MKEKIVKAENVPPASTDPPNPRHLKMLFCPELENYDKATILFSYVPPNTDSGLHSHPDCDEIMYFMGKGVFFLGDEEVKIEDDTVIIAPKGVPHGGKNTSTTESMKIFCVYIPPMKPVSIYQKAIDVSREKLKELAGE